MADVARLLETLHPLREPPAPAPIAPVLAMLAIGCVAAMLAFVVAWRVGRRRTAVRGAAAAALAASRALAPPERLAAQAGLLRRLVRGALGEPAAREQGEAWLRRLDQMFETRFFTEDAGVVFGDPLYRRPSDLDVEALDRSLLGFFAKMPVGARA